MTEKFSSTTNLDLIIATTATNDTNKTPVNEEKRKKKRGSFNLLKTALFMLRNGSNRKPTLIQLEAAKASNGNWKKIVGSMRPLHLPDHPSPPSSVTAELAPLTVEQFEETMIAPASPSQSSSSGGTMSQYASANNLQELDNRDESDDDDEDPDDVFDAIGADELIDAKAEMFIAQFYHQMRLQNLGSVNRHN